MSQLKFNTNFWVGIIIMIMVMIGLFYVARGIFTLLAWAAPVLLILTLIIRHQVILSYGKMVLNLLKKNPLMGVVAIILTIIGFPIVAFALFGKALLDRKIDKLGDLREEAYKDEFVEYEELEDDSLQLPDMEKPARSDYDDLLSDQ